MQMKNKLLLTLLVTIFAFTTTSLFAGDVDVKGMVFGKVPYTLAAGYHQSHVKHMELYAKKKYGIEVRVIDGETTNNATLAAAEAPLVNNPPIPSVKTDAPNNGSCSAVQLIALSTIPPEGILASFSAILLAASSFRQSASSF